VLAARDGEVRAEEASIAAEEPLQILTETATRPPTRLAVTMRTPGHEQELAIGFLFTEGLIRGAEDLAKPSVREVFPGVGKHNEITVRLARDFDPAELTRSFFATSSCGVCGKASIEQIERHAPPIATGAAAVTVRGEVLATLPAKLRAAQAQFDETGGVHAVALFTRDGAPLVVREDVGRHNAMDKVIGRRVLDGCVPERDVIALVSGRASFELVQKAAMAGVPVLCAISAPSSLAVKAAARLGMTLVGFLRDGRYTIYAHPERVV
jgi:FdhD protein